MEDLSNVSELNTIPAGAICPARINFLIRKEADGVILEKWQYLGQYIHVSEYGGSLCAQLHVTNGEYKDFSIIHYFPLWDKNQVSVRSGTVALKQIMKALEFENYMLDDIEKFNDQYVGIVTSVRKNIHTGNETNGIKEFVPYNIASTKTAA